MSNSTAKSKTVARRIDQAAKSAHHIHAAVHDAKSAVSRNGAQAVGTIQALREKVQDGTKVAITKVKKAAASVRAQAVRADKTIRAKPYQSLGVAAGAGLVAGYLISRRRSNAS
jgi:ElaB/YqjD/DUF883 family membrane-anchored ribosome-binding protein